MQALTLPLATWLNAFLEARGLTQPDGRPLFAYKATADEYRQLSELLSKTPTVETHSTRYYQGWLLFAAEWWKREYAGGAWRWAPVFEAMHRPVPDYAHVQRGVVEGRRAWHLTDPLADGKKYIGQVAINGGLPMRLLEGAQGGLARILRMVLEDAVTFSLSQPQIYAAIEIQAANLPSSYRQTLVYELLASIIRAVLDLRADALTDGDADPITCLNANRPEWESLFPLALESTAASALIKGLVRSAASFRTETTGVPFRVLRGLRFGEPGEVPRPEISFQMRSRVKRRELATVLDLPEEQIPPSFQLLLQVAGKEYLVGEGFLRGDDAHLVSKVTSLPAALSGAQLIVSRYGATVTTASLPGGDELEPTEPWVFEEAYPFAPLLGQGDCRVKAESALVLAPADAVIVSLEGDYTYVHQACLGDKCLVRLQPGTTRFRYKGGAFSISCDPNAAASVSAQWQARSEHYRSSPAAVFLGFPVVSYEQPNGGMAHAPITELFQKVGNDQIALSSNNKRYGLCTLLWKHGGATALRTRAVILPTDSEIRYRPGRGANEGAITLRNWPALDVASADNNIQLTCRKEGTDLHLEVSHSSKGLIPELPLLIRWEGGTQEITLPYPARGAVLLDANGAPIPRNSSRRISELVGCRALLLPNPESPAWSVRLSLQYDGGLLEQWIRYGNVREIRLHELAGPLRAMLSSVPDLDRRVRVELVNNHQTQASLDVGRYSTLIQLDPGKTRASLHDGLKELMPSQDLNSQLLSALPLQYPDEEPVPLPGRTSQSVFTGSWDVSLPASPSGPWLLYTPEGSTYLSRPAIVMSSALPPADSRLSPLRHALGVADREGRHHALVDALNAMAKKPAHPDWAVFEQLFKKLGHLPLPSLDIWHALVDAPSAWVMAFLHVEGFAELLAARFPIELPAEWLLVSPATWIEAFAVLKAHYVGPDQERTFRFLKQDIEAKKELILHLQPGLRFIFQLAFHHGFGQEDREVQLYAAMPDAILGGWLELTFFGEDSHLQRLIQRAHAVDAKWPVMLRDQVEDFVDSDTGRSFLQQPALRQLRIPADDDKWPVILLPFLVAYDVVAGRGQRWQQDPMQLFQLRLYRQFDDLWFDAAYCTGLALAFKDMIRT